jgi:Ca2+/Na+ antiporter
MKKKIQIEISLWIIIFIIILLYLFSTSNKIIKRDETDRKPICISYIYLNLLFISK